VGRRPKLKEVRRKNAGRRRNRALGGGRRRRDGAFAGMKPAGSEKKGMGAMLNGKDLLDAWTKTDSRSEKKNIYHDDGTEKGTSRDSIRGLGRKSYIGGYDGSME